jgi:hypothetical protein
MMAMTRLNIIIELFAIVVTYLEYFGTYLEFRVLIYQSHVTA